MLSFQQLWENIQSEKSKPSSQDDKAMAAIRTGIGIRDNFWDDFLLVINNSESLSALLDVPVTKIADWHARIRQDLDKVKKSDMSPETKEKTELLKTGLPDDSNPDAIMKNSM